MLQETQTETKKKSKRVHLLRASALTDAELALDSLLNEAPVKVSPTAAAVVEAHIHKIVELRSKKVSPRRIYESLKKATGMRISYEAFQSYVSTAAHAAGLREGTAKKKADAATPLQKENWRCGDCQAKAVKKSYGSKTFYECPSCQTAYNADENGAITPTPFSTV